MLATRYYPSQTKFPCFAQPKYDGVRCILHEGEDGEIHLTSRGGKEYDVPQIKAWGRNTAVCFLWMGRYTTTRN